MDLMQFIGFLKFASLISDLRPLRCASLELWHTLRAIIRKRTATRNCIERFAVAIFSLDRVVFLAEPWNIEYMEDFNSRN